MADVMPSQLANSVMAKFYDVLTNGDEDVPAPSSSVFTFLTPQVTFLPEDLDFLSQGLTGVVRKEAADILRGPGEAADPQPLPAAELERLRAQDAIRVHAQAENWSNFLNIIVDVAKGAADPFAKLQVQHSRGSLSEVYALVLRMSQVMHTELPEATKAKIEKFRNLLSTKIQKTNIVTDEVTEVVEPSELTKAYLEKSKAYADAVFAYNDLRIAAMSGADSQAVHAWALNGATRRNAVKAAMADWVSNGYKNEYEQMSAFIDQVGQRDLTLLKAQYRDDFERARMTGITSGMDYYFTSLAPSNFARSPGWTKFTFKSTDMQSHGSSTYANKRWNLSGGASWLGIFGGRGGAESTSSHQEFTSTLNSDEFELSFEITQVPIIRSWLGLGFLNSKTWRFDPGNPELKGELLSDGGAPPKGLMTAIPMAMVVVQNLELKLGHSESFQNFVRDTKNSSQGGDGYVRFGPFFLGGGGKNMSSTESTTRDWGFKQTEQGISAPGMQVAGFQCHVFDEARPAPLDSITEWV
jgi:hypothetical protein